jgi:hypothetical protein
MLNANGARSQLLVNFVLVCMNIALAVLYEIGQH